MADYVKVLSDDLVEQFRGKANIEALIEVVGEELNEVFRFFASMKETRNVYTATGAQLDGIGNIVDMSRMQATILAGEEGPVGLLDDEAYRIYLIYKILINTCDCTYRNIMKGLNLLWDGRLTYSETQEEPATITLSFERFVGNDIEKLLSIPIIKPAGVRIKFRSTGVQQATTYVGGSMVQYRKTTFVQQEAPVIPMYLVDEDGVLLADENGDILCEGS